MTGYFSLVLKNIIKEVGKTFQEILFHQEILRTQNASDAQKYLERIKIPKEERHRRRQTFTRHCFSRHCLPSNMGGYDEYSVIDPYYTEQQPNWFPTMQFNLNNSMGADQMGR